MVEVLRIILFVIAICANIGIFYGFYLFITRGRRAAKISYLQGHIMVLERQYRELKEKINNGNLEKN